MEISALIGQKRYAIDTAKPHDISIPMRFDGKSVVAFGAPPASRVAYATRGFIGDVKKGGSCNCDMLTFSPHLHGTHTECVGHIADGLIAVHEVLSNTLFPATLVTVAPEPASNAKERYDPPPSATDLMITSAALQKALEGKDSAFLEALVIRTGAHMLLPPFFSSDAIAYLNKIGVQHLLVDIPSIDRSDDEGKLSNHHLFWGVPQGSHKVDNTRLSPKTVTELIQVPDSVADGTYMLNLQVAAFMSDAAPSRPVLYGVAPL